MDYYGIGMKTSGNIGVDMSNYTKCTKCVYNKNKGTICDLTKKWCYSSKLSCMLISEVKMKDEFNGPKPGLYKVVKKKDVRYFMHKNNKQLLDYTQENLNLLTKVVKKDKKKE